MIIFSPHGSGFFPPEEGEKYPLGRGKNPLTFQLLP
jgi:hypothetical protein